MSEKTTEETRAELSLLGALQGAKQSAAAVVVPQPSAPKPADVTLAPVAASVKAPTIFDKRETGVKYTDVDTNSMLALLEQREAQAKNTAVKRQLTEFFQGFPAAIQAELALMLIRHAWSVDCTLSARFMTAEAGYQEDARRKGVSPNERQPMKRAEMIRMQRAFLEAFQRSGGDINRLNWHIVLTCNPVVTYLQKYSEFATGETTIDKNPAAIYPKAAFAGLDFATAYQRMLGIWDASTKLFNIARKELNLKRIDAIDNTKSGAAQDLKKKLLEVSGACREKAGQRILLLARCPQITGILHAADHRDARTQDPVKYKAQIDDFSGIVLGFCILSNVHLNTPIVYSPGLMKDAVALSKFFRYLNTIAFYCRYARVDTTQARTQPFEKIQLADESTIRETAQKVAAAFSSE